ncbi:unnamed protein product [Parajaminaea phylloscopi]
MDAGNEDTRSSDGPTRIASTSAPLRRSRASLPAKPTAPSPHSQSHSSHHRPQQYRERSLHGTTSSSSSSRDAPRSERPPSAAVGAAPSSSSSSSYAYNVDYAAHHQQQLHRRQHVGSSGIGPISSSYTMSSAASSSSSSSSSHPSPSTSSTTSSLRTPPDLYPHGLSSSSTALKTLHSDGTLGPAKRFLSISEIDQRLQLLDTLASDLNPTLPPPPSAAEERRRSTSAHTPASKKAHTATVERNESTRKQTNMSSEPHQSAAAASTSARASASTSSASHFSTPSSTPPASASAPNAAKKRTSKALADAEDGSGNNGKRHSSTTSRGSTTPQDSRKPADTQEPSRKKTKTRTSTSTNSRDYTSSPSPPPENTRSRTTRKSPPKATASSSSSSSSSSPQPDAASVQQVPPRRSWTREDYVATGTMYQARGRALKHAGDRRLREANSTFDRGAMSAAQRVAIHQHTEAILLFIYGFWCEDWAASLKNASSTSSTGGSRTCIVANWSSLSGLLHYVCASHEKHKDEALAGFCRFLEAMVLRHTASFEQRQVQQRLSRLASSTAVVEPSAQTDVASPAPSAASPTESNGPAAHAVGADIAGSLADLSSAMSRIVADEERSSKLFAVTRNQLSNAVLARDFPQTWQLCQTSMLDPFKTANDLDPASAPSDAKVPLPAQARWAWPLGAGEGQMLSVFPHVVNFGRSLLRESAQRRKLTAYRLSDLSSSSSATQ